MIEVPVQRLDVLGGLQDNMSQPLHPSGFTQRPLGGVDSPQLVAEVEHVAVLGCQRLELVRARDHVHLNAAGIDQVDRDTADGLG